MDMDLKQARAIARAVGATIEEKTWGEYSPNDTGLHSKDTPVFIARLGVCKIGPNGTREYPTYSAGTPGMAANYAVLNTAKICNEMAAVAKQVYVDSDLIYMAAH